MMKYFTFCCFLVVATSLFAQDCSPGWEFYRDVTIDNSAGPALTDYQVKISLNTAQLATDGKLRGDGADLRVFTADCTLLPFWGDSLGTSQTTDIWVKIPSIAAGASTTLQVYYGRPAATSAADGDNTFLFFDDFNSESIDPAKWETVGEFAEFAVVDSIARYGSTGSSGESRFKFARTATTFSEKVIFDYNGAATNSNGFGFSSGTEPLERILWRISGAFGFDTLNQVAIMRDTISNGVALVNNYPLLRFPRGVLHTRSVTVESNENDNLQVTRFANVGLGTENTDLFVQENVNMPSFHFIMSSFNAGSPTLLDNIRVRQFTDVPPVSSIGDELMATPSGVRFLLAASEVKVFPNPASGLVNVEIATAESVNIVMTDVLGRRVASQKVDQLDDNTWQLDVSHLDRGIYFLQLYRSPDGSLLHTRKVTLR